MHEDQMEHRSIEDCGGRLKPRTFLAILVAAASCVFVAAYVYGLASGVSKDDTIPCSQNTPVKEESHRDGSDTALGSPAYVSDEEHSENSKGPTSAVTTTGQRVAGHLLAVLLLASVSAAIVETVRARMARSAVHKPSEVSPSCVSSETVQHHSSNHGGRASRRCAMQEKSYSCDGHIYRSRSSSAEVCNQQVGMAASAAVAGVRAQKVLRVRLGGKVGNTPPLLRRSSFPVVSRTPSIGGRDSNGGSPSLGSRKPSINDPSDDDMGDFQKKRVRLIRRF